MAQFSILMANHNNARFIDEAIQSVLDQTFGDWELVIVDDASVDDSVERIRKYLKDARIRLYRKERNEGYTKALIFGLTKVSSGIVGILDSDDALTINAIEKAHAVHTQNPEIRKQLAWTSASNMQKTGISSLSSRRWPRRSGSMNRCIDTAF
jgi:glycosyltransferase involved in cell wall biosynthesis